jgi:hypothetical protein
MWLPASMYERLPQVWLVMGLLFFAYALYQGLNLPTSLGSLVMGFMCWVYGVGISIVRSRYRGRHSENDDAMAASH